MKSAMKYGLSVIIGAGVGAIITYVITKAVKNVNLEDMFDDEFEYEEFEDNDYECDCKCGRGNCGGDGCCHDSCFDNVDGKSEKESDVKLSSIPDESFTGATINIADDVEEAIEAKEAIEPKAVNEVI